MSERSIAEIIGWRQNGGDMEYRPFYVLAGGEGYRYGEPTVDDMLAWLRHEISAEHPENTDSIEIWWDPEEPDKFAIGIGVFSWHRPTLLAAVEAAVRHVAAEDVP